MSRKLNEEYLRSSIFGLEDALISTTGVVIGISTGIQDIKFILLASLVTVTVEAFAMGAGQFLTEETVHEIEKKRRYFDNSVVGAIIMFVSYLLAGLIPVIPILFLSFPAAIFGSLVAAFIGLFILGFVKGKIVKVDPVKSAVKMLAVGGLATIAGAVVGYLFKLK